MALSSSSGTEEANHGQELMSIGGAGGTSNEEPGGDLESNEEDEGNTMGGSPRAEDDGAGRNSRSKVANLVWRRRWHLRAGSCGRKAGRRARQGAVPPFMGRGARGHKGGGGHGRLGRWALAGLAGRAGAGAGGLGRAAGSAQSDR
jgi:hypothetical protein